MKNIRPLLLLLAFAFVLNACKKDDDPAPQATKTDLLTAKPWKIQTYSVDPPLEIVVDTTTGETEVVRDILAFYKKYQATCRTDDELRFTKTNDYTREEGATQCTPGKDILETGTWTFNGAETVIALTVPGYTPDNYTIVKLDETTLELTQTVTSNDGTKYTFTEVYTNQ